jgi:hypothetical protein
VFGGGRSSLIARASRGGRSRALITVACQDFGGPERSQIEPVALGRAEHDSDLAQQGKIFNDIYT